MINRSLWSRGIFVLLISLVVSSTTQAQEKKRPGLVVQNGHFTDVRTIAYSADERLIASASEDGAIKLWAADSGILLRTLNASTNVHDVAFSPDGQTIAASTKDNIKFWLIESGTLVRTLEVKGVSYDAIFSVAFSADWKLLAVCMAGGLVNVWDVPGGTLVRRFKTENFTVGGKPVAAFSPDGKTLAFSDAKTIKLWELATGAPLHTLAGHTDDVICLAFSPDGRVLASGSGSILTRKDNSARLWDVASGALLHTLEGKAPEKNSYNYPMVRSVAFSPDGKLLLTEGQDNALKLWDVASGKLARVLKDRFYSGALALSPSWQTYASEYLGDHAIQLWDRQSGVLLRKFAGQSQGIGLLTFSPDGKQMAVTVGGNDDLGQIIGYVWDFESGPISSMPIYFTGSPHLVFNSDALLSIGIDLSGKISIGQASRAGFAETIHDSAPEMVVGARALAPDGQFLAVADVNKRTIRLWDLQQRKLARSLAGHESVITSLAFSPDGKQLASASWDKTIKLWDTRTGQLARTLTGHTSSVTAVAFSPDGKTLISGSADYLVDRDHSIRLWESQSGQPMRTLDGHASGVTLLAVSPDGKSLASTGRGGEVRLWDLSSGELRHSVAATGVETSALIYHPSGRFLVTGSADATIKILSPTDGTLIATIIAFDDGNWLITSPSTLFDGSAAAWDRILWRFSPALRDIAPVEIFFNEFYYPDLLADLLAGRAPKVTQEITQKDRRQPRVRLALADAPTALSDVTTRNALVRIEVSEAEAGAQDVRLFRNGSLVKVWRGDVLKGQPIARLEATIPIVAGENRLTAYAFNHDNVKSSDATLIIKGADALKREGVAYILAVGVNHYANKQYDLKYAVADAQAFAAEVKLQQEELHIYERVEVLPLYDADATKDNILKAIAQLATKAQPEDAVIVYFSGHGTASQQRFYLIPYDLGYQGQRTKLSAADLKTILDHSISDREVEEAFERIDAGQLLMVVDACNSGQALDSEEKRRGPMNSKGLAQLAYEKGMYILTAAQSYQAAWEASRLGHGYLTYSLIEEGLKKGTADRQPKDDEILLREWLDYATDRVPQMQEEKLKDTPKIKDQQGRELEFVFVEGDETIKDPTKRTIQRPRVFYRRETESSPLIVARPERAAP